MNKKFIPLSLLIFPAITALVSCGGSDTKTAVAAPAAKDYQVITISPRSTTLNIDYPATIEGQQNVEIRPKIDGYVEKIYVDEGQMVKKGQLLFKLETQTLNQDASASKAMVQAAQVEVDRLKPLVDRKIISNVQLETAKAKLAQAKSAYGSIAANIGYGTITSPVNGVVGSLPYREGSLVSMTSEMPLTTVSDSKVIRAYFTMNEKQLLSFNKTFKGSNTVEKLKNVPEVSLLLVDDSEYNVKGKIATINGLVNPQTGTTEFRAEFKNPEGLLRSGSTGIIRLPIEQKDVIVVPQNAVFEVQGKQMIYVVGKDNKVKSTIITTNGTSGLNFIVIDGLSEGDVIVVEGASKLKDDMEIVPQGKTAQPQTATDSVAKPEIPTKK